MKVRSVVESKNPILEFLQDRFVMWVAFIGFGATLGLAIGYLLDRTGDGVPGLAVILGASATLSLGTIGEAVIRIGNLLERQPPSPPSTTT